VLLKYVCPQFLNSFELGDTGDTGEPSSLIVTKRSKNHWVRIARTELAWQAQLQRATSHDNDCEMEKMGV